MKITVKSNSPLLKELQYWLAKKARLNAEEMERTAAVIEDAAYVIREVWRGFAMGGKLEGVEQLKKPNDGYARSIQISPRGRFQYEVGSDAPIADQIERGTKEKEIDMKKTHPFGPRSRISAKGVPYLIIPFRWGTPAKKGETRVGFKNVMPIKVHDIVKKFETSRVTKSADDPTARKTPNAQRKMVGRAVYKWGDRLDTSALAGTEKEKRDMNGMVRMANSGGYFTFRVISANSPAGSWKWTKPAEPPRPVRQAVLNATKDMIDKNIQTALGEDFRI